MRYLFIILLSLTTFIAGAQINPNSATTAYQSLASAIKYPKDEGWKVDVIENGVVKHFITVLRSRGFIPNGGTIIACADSLSALLLDQSQANGVKLSYFLKNDGITDNAAKMNWLVSTASPYSHFIIERGDNFFSSQNIVPQKDITIIGPDGYEMVNSGTAFFTFPIGVTGFVFNNINSAGSLLRGFTIKGTIPEYGRILEYNPANATALCLLPGLTITPGKSFEFRDVYHPDKVKGTATISSVSTNNMNYSVMYHSRTGTFAIGDTIKGTTSGAKAVVRFVSRLYPALAVSTVSGTFTFAETITGTSSGATAKFYQRPTPSSFQYTKVATISNVTGSLDNPQNDTTSTTDGSIVNADSTQFGVTGNIDSLGITGKRQNIFIEAGKYSVGVVINRRVTMEDMTVTGFGNGIYITSLTSPITNANLARLNRVRSSVNAANGLQVEGGDANSVTVSNSTFVADGGHGIVDLSFLQLSVNNVHSAACLVGAYTSANYVNRKSLWTSIYSEGGYVLKPWQMEENYIGGSSGAIGGVWGQENVTSLKSTAKNSGFRLDIDHLQNNNLYTDNSNIRNPAIVFKGQGTQSVPLIIEQGGNGGSGRGGLLGYRVPAGAGFNGVDPVGATLYMGGMQGTTVGANNYALDFWERRNVPPAITITSTTGTGAILQADILNGKLTKINILASGKSYPPNTTLSIPNSPGTTLIPIIGDSSFLDVVIQGDSITTNLDDDIYSVWKLRNDGAFYPTTANTNSIGTSTNPVNDIWVNNLHTSGAASSQYIWNQNSALQPANFNIGSNLPFILTNHGSVAATADPDITNPGLEVIARAGSDGYYSPFHVHQSGLVGLDINTWADNAGSISEGAHYRTLSNGYLGGYYARRSTASAIALFNGTIHFQTGNNLTIGAIQSLPDVMSIDSMVIITPKSTAPNGLQIRTVKGSNTDLLTFGSTTDGRTIGVTTNSVPANLTYNANKVIYNSIIGVGAGKTIAFTSNDGSNTGAVATNLDGTGNFYWNVNGINAQIMTTTGRTVFGGPVNPKSYTVATLPASPFTNDIVIVTDALNPINGAPVVGGGTTLQPVFRNANQWIVMGAGGFWTRTNGMITTATATDSLTIGGTVKIGTMAIGNISNMDVTMRGSDNILYRVAPTNFLSAQHPASIGSAPTVAGGTNVSAAMNSTGKDVQFNLTLVVGTGGATGTIATVTYNTAWAQTPTVTFSAANAAAANANNQIYANATSTNTLLVSTTGTLAAGTYILNFHTLQ